MPNSKAAVASQVAMDGGNGGWAVLYGSDPITPTGSTLKLAIDEDQAKDSERKHTTEQVASFVTFASALAQASKARSAAAAESEFGLSALAASAGGSMMK
ncbi:MAG: hypothetical protein ACYTG0_14310 [Planctomycetota bacterium]|jgi:hypothetical protein